MRFRNKKLSIRPGLSIFLLLERSLDFPTINHEIMLQQNHNSWSKPNLISAILNSCTGRVKIHASIYNVPVAAERPRTRKPLPIRQGQKGIIRMLRSAAKAFPGPRSISHIILHRSPGPAANTHAQQLDFILLPPRNDSLLLHALFFYMFSLQFPESRFIFNCFGARLPNGKCFHQPRSNALLHELDPLLWPFVFPKTSNLPTGSVFSNLRS